MTDTNEPTAGELFTQALQTAISGTTSRRDPLHQLFASSDEQPPPNPAEHTPGTSEGETL